MTTTLITGANKGLGREAARRLIAAGHDVWIGARNAEAGQLAADELGARFVQLDVTDDASVAAAVETVRAAGGLDVLVNNAGIATGGATVAETTVADFEAIYGTNVFGLVRVTQAFLPLLLESSAPNVVMVASGLGSQAWCRDPEHVESTVTSISYPSSKSAVLMIATQYAKAYPQVRINAVDPGYTATDLNGNSGHQTVEEGTDAMVAMAQIGPDGPTGEFHDRKGIVPW